MYCDQTVLVCNQKSAKAHSASESNTLATIIHSSLGTVNTDTFT